MRSHVIISGTGRAGTTFLVQLMTEAGLDTGFEDKNSNVFENCHAGMERDIRSPEAPFIVKDPSLCEYLESVLEKGEVKVEHAIVPVRDLFAAAESRRAVSEKSESPMEAPGGLWSVDSPAQQEQVLTLKLYKLIHCLTKWDIPTTFVSFPRIVEDPDYLFDKLGFLFQGMSREEFQECFERVARPELVKNFSEAASQRANQA